jgi:glycosyltransferase involved in cell wall biosynthesis
VYLEALMHGLPTIGHRHPVIEYVLGDAGIVADLSKPGELAEVVLQMLKCENTETLKTGIAETQVASDQISEYQRISDSESSVPKVSEFQHVSVSAFSPQARWSSVRDRFSWDVLRPHYVEMFRAAAVAPIEWTNAGNL